METQKCNFCGKELDFWDKQNNFSFKGAVGYGSSYDGEFIEIHLCCDCFDKALNKFSPKFKVGPVKIVE